MDFDYGYWYVHTLAVTSERTIQAFMSRRHAAERLDVSTRTIDRLRAAGELAWLRVGGVVRIERISIEGYEERQRARADVSWRSIRSPMAS